MCGGTAFLLGVPPPRWRVFPKLHSLETGKQDRTHGRIHHGTPTSPMGIDLRNHVSFLSLAQWCHDISCTGSHFFLNGPPMLPSLGSNVLWGRDLDKKKQRWEFFCPFFLLHLLLWLQPPEGTDFQKTEPKRQGQPCRSPAVYSAERRDSQQLFVLCEWLILMKLNQRLSLHL